MEIEATTSCGRKHLHGGRTHECCTVEKEECKFNSYICKKVILLITYLHLRSIVVVYVNMRRRSFRYPNVSRWIIIYHGDVYLLK